MTIIRKQISNSNGHASPAPGGDRLTAALRRLSRPADTGPTPALNIVNIVSVAPPQLGDDAYHGHIGDFIRSVAPYTEAADAAIIAHLLPAIGTLIGPGPTFYAGNDQPCRVNCVVCGETNSGRKGTSAYPVDALMTSVDDLFWPYQRVGGLSSGEGLIQKVADKVDEKGNITYVEKRLFVLEEEFARVLANMRRDGNILSHIVRQAFDSGNLATLTVNPRRAHGAHISLVAHITPEELDKRFDGIEAANGFGNRYLWFYVASDKMIPHPKPIPERVFLAFAPRLRQCAELKKQHVRMDTDAENLWADVYPRLREDRPGVVGAITARGAPIVLRLALIYAIVDCPKTPVIRDQHIRAALSVWKYSAESAELLFDSKTGDKLGDRLYNLLRTNGAMTTKDFHRHLSNDQKRDLQTTLEKLKGQKLIRSETLKTKGRPKTVWKLKATDPL